MHQAIQGLVFWQWECPISECPQSWKWLAFTVTSIKTIELTDFDPSPIHLNWVELTVELRQKSNTYALEPQSPAVTKGSWLKSQPVETAPRQFIWAYIVLRSGIFILSIIKERLGSSTLSKCITCLLGHSAFRVVSKKCLSTIQSA